jgi:DNA repair exonuclease SbcCD ATPase subunit
VIVVLERSRTIGVQLVAREEAALEQLDAVAAERDALAGSLEATSLEAGRLRYLAGRFGLKGIPARVIEGVLPELTAYANEVLGELFGLRLELRATRASADGRSTIEALELVVTKDDVGEVELARASGGQGTAIALALALGLSRLNARRAGTAIRSLVIDEPEGLDVIRLKALGAYLRELLHRGELDRAFVITHTTELTEFGDRVDEVIEGPDGAQLRQVA